VRKEDTGRVLSFQLVADVFVKGSPKKKTKKKKSTPFDVAESP
jgi:hypothetical protein